MSIASYGYIRGSRDAASKRLIEVVEGRLQELIRPWLVTIEFDEEYYRMANPDVNEKIVQGGLKSGHDHYLFAGYFEDRLPRPVEVDESWYVREYSDVGEAIRRGVFMSAAQHFGTDGFKEGRLPHAGWSLEKGRRP